MKKNIFYIFLFFLAIASSCNAMNQEPQSSKECYEKINGIKEDFVWVYEFLGAGFEAAQDGDNIEHTPSFIIKLFNSDKIDKTGLELTHMSFHEYVERLYKDHFDELDQEFLKKYNETKNLKATWKWFKEEYFKTMHKKWFNECFNKTLQSLSVMAQMRKYFEVDED